MEWVIGIGIFMCLVVFSVISYLTSIVKELKEIKIILLKQEERNK